MRFSEDALSTFEGSDGSLRTVHQWSPSSPRAVLVAIHGGMAHGGDYQVPALFFKDRGWATVSFDQAGHDRQQRVDVPNFDIFLQDAVLFLDWVAAHYPGLPLLVVGHSMGGLIVSHLELKGHLNRPSIRGVVLSSPYFVNAIQMPPFLVKLASLLARVWPTGKVPLPQVTDELTHDPVVTARHFVDEQDHVRAHEASFRFANALLQAQAELGGDLRGWRHPVFAVLAGQDRLANTPAAQAWLATVPAGLLTCHTYADNFHENFNELNRETLFNQILEWAENEQVLGL